MTRYIALTKNLSIQPGVVTVSMDTFMFTIRPLWNMNQRLKAMKNAIFLHHSNNIVCLYDSIYTMARVHQTIMSLSYGAPKSVATK